MKTLDNRTVVLDGPGEEDADRWFHQYLDRGQPINQAAKFSLNRMLAAGHPVTDEFAAWLSEGTVERWGRRFRIKTRSSNEARGLLHDLRAIDYRLASALDTLSVAQVAQVARVLAQMAEKVAEHADPNPPYGDDEDDEQVPPYGGPIPYRVKGGTTEI